MENILKMDLQFFADESGEEVSEVAEPIEDVTEEVSEEQAEEENVVEEPEFDRNAIAAAARREAEAKLRARDEEFVRRFGDLKNPETGAPIRNEADYFAALDAQERMKRNQELRDKGIDPSIIDNAIKNNPVVRQAEMVLQQNQAQILQHDIEEQVKQINAIDPSIRSLEDIANNEAYADILRMVQGGYGLFDAYRLANYDSLLGKSKAAAEQKAINQAKGKSHLTPTSSGSTQGDGLEDIPESAIAKWRAFFPDATDKELREKYNRARK